MDKNKPNILLIMTDQQRYNSLGCYGSGVVPTPNLDKLAAEGLRFNNCYVNNPVCTPSRASIWTGKPLNGHGVFRLHDILPDKEILFPELLRKKGYKTGLFGKLHVSGRSHEYNNRHPHDGFDIYEYTISPHNVDGKYNAYAKWLKKNHSDFFTKLKKEGREIGNFPPELHITHWAAERTIDYIKKENRNENNPFFACMSIIDPHDPYNDYPEEMGKLVDEDEISEPIMREDSVPEAVNRESNHSYLGGYSNYSDEQIRKMKRGYFASIAFFDREIGRVLGVLDKEGIKENTLVIFVSDHGDMLGDHQLLAKGAFFYDPCSKVPLIIRYPEKISKSNIINELVQPHDIAATVLTQAKFSRDELKEIMPDSQNLISLAKNKSSENFRDHAVCMYRNTSICDKKVYWDPQINATMYRSNRYKLNIYHSLNGVKDLQDLEGELYDMENDPQEINNLWSNSDYRDIKQKLLLDFMNWMVKNEINYNRSKKDAFPDKSEWCENNPL